MEDNIDRLTHMANWNNRKPEYQTKWCKIHGFVDFTPQYFHGGIQSWRCVQCKKDSGHRKLPGCPKETGDFGENLAMEMIPGLERAERGSRGDYKCPDERYFDVKTASLCHIRPRNMQGEWVFDIRKNDKVDNFLLIALQSKSPIEVKGIWWIAGDEVINGRKINERKSFSITPRKIAKMDQYIVKRMNDLCQRKEQK
jgi:hypothetical protein